jgi:hypothetical protein
VSFTVRIAEHRLEEAPHGALGRGVLGLRAGLPARLVLPAERGLHAVVDAARVDRSLA